MIKFRNRPFSRLAHYSKWYGLALLFLVLASQSADIYRKSSAAASYARAGEAEAGLLKGTAQQVVNNKASNTTAVQFGKDGKCVVAYPQKLYDQSDPNEPRRAWAHNPSKPTTVYMNVSTLSAEYRTYVQQAATQWTNLVPECLDVRVVTACPAAVVACVPFSETAEYKGGVGGGTILGEFYPYVDYVNNLLLSGKIVMYTKTLSTMSPALRSLVVRHEIGHSFGLKHRATDHTLMHAMIYDNSKSVDAIDRANIFGLYGLPYISSQSQSLSNTLDLPPEELLPPQYREEPPIQDIRRPY